MAQMPFMPALSGKQVIGQTFSHYKIMEKIGEGGMGYVYRALDLNLQSKVALKILPPHLCRKVEEKKQFLQEARLLSSLDHPYICTIHDIFETADGTLFMVISCYKGETLRRYMENGKLNPEETISIIKQIGCGLTTAHEIGIIHQDVKPENIMITGETLVKIIDFGIAKLISKNEEKTDKKTIGTIAYMSPEQLNQNAVDQRTDIWTLGVVLYEMLSGHQPFQGEYEEAIIYSVINEKPDTIPGLPERLQNIVFKCLVKDPDKRYQTVCEFLTDLEVYRVREKRLHNLPSEKKDKKQLRFWPGVALITALLFF